MAKISPKQYAQTLFDITKDKDRKEVDSIVARFVEQLGKNGHMKYGMQIADAFEKIYNAKNHIVHAQVTTASRLTDAQKEMIEKKIICMYEAREADIIYKEDRQVAGGIIIRVNDEIIDASVRKRLRLLEKQLT